MDITIKKLELLKKAVDLGCQYCGKQHLWFADNGHHKDKDYKIILSQSLIYPDFQLSSEWDKFDVKKVTIKRNYSDGSSQLFHGETPIEYRTGGYTLMGYILNGAGGSNIFHKEQYVFNKKYNAFVSEIGAWKFDFFPLLMNEHYLVNYETKEIFLKGMFDKRLLYKHSDFKCF